MQKCKKSDTHSFAIDTPVFFSQDKPSIEEYYQLQVSAILNGTDDWFYKRTHVFTHLKCEYCQKEEHVSFPASYLQTIINDPSVRFGIQTIKRLQVALPDGEKITYEVNLHTGEVETK
jgi:hypothetical protein